MRANSKISFVSITIIYVIILRIYAAATSTYCKYNRTNDTSNENEEIKCYLI